LIINTKDTFNFERSRNEGSEEKYFDATMLAGDINLWEEKVGKQTDKKLYGPTSLGMGFSFP